MKMVKMTLFDTLNLRNVISRKNQIFDKLATLEILCLLKIVIKKHNCDLQLLMARAEGICN